MPNDSNPSKASPKHQIIQDQSDHEFCKKLDEAVRRGSRVSSRNISTIFDSRQGSQLHLYDSYPAGSNRARLVTAW